MSTSGDVDNVHPTNAGATLGGASDTVTPLQEESFTLRPLATEEAEADTPDRSVSDASH
jgi:hypothetical protein